MIKVKDHEGLVRDPHSQGILVESTPSTRQAIERNRAERQRAARLDQLEDKMEKILSMMDKIVEKLDGN